MTGHNNPNLPIYFIEAQKQLSRFCSENEDKELYMFDVQETKEYEDGRTSIRIDVVFKD